MFLRKLGQKWRTWSGPCFILINAFTRRPSFFVCITFSLANTLPFLVHFGVYWLSYCRPFHQRIIAKPFPLKSDHTWWAIKKLTLIIWCFLPGFSMGWILKVSWISLSFNSEFSLIFFVLINFYFINKDTCLFLNLWIKVVLFWSWIASVKTFK